MNEKTGTRIYGQSDDNIYCDGEYEGQYSSYDHAEDGILLVVSDGTLLEIKYGKGDLSIWGITVIKKGQLLLEIEICDDPSADIYSDVACFKPGIQYIYACSKWAKID